MTYPLIRKAQPSDYDSIWNIWMQEHIIQWMSFTKQTQEEFRKHYEHMENTSDIYVLVDKIAEEEKVVGVRRIKWGKNQYQHIAEYCSMGIDKNYQGLGYAKFFYQEFEKIARAKGIKRIQLTQSGGNLAAFHLADYQFSEEAVFPDWLPRQANEGNFYLIERYMYQFLDDELASLASKIPSLSYQEMIPSLKLTKNDATTIQQSGNQYFATFNDQPLLTLELEPDDSVIKHIGFISINLHLPEQPDAVWALQKILTNILEEGRVKKVEIFTIDATVAKLCQQCGFFMRGEKIASYYDEKEGYKNELGLEKSFFNIKDAQSLIKAKVTDFKKSEKLTSTLAHCAEKIKYLIDNKTCDRLGAAYLENIIYQMVRDDLGPNKVFSLENKRWCSLTQKLPTDLGLDLQRLENRLEKTSLAFFKPQKDKEHLQGVEKKIGYQG